MDDTSTMCPDSEAGDKLSFLASDTDLDAERPLDYGDMISSLTQGADFPQEYGENTENQTKITSSPSITASPCQDVSEDCHVA
eukprot:3128173-Karenia_brevis.AAC.1